ncbi:ThrRS/AlaRS common domain-containing protein [Nadsonia fulvescens var. elongata DSM 6958]|uniref:ThrRS/AlaRS common domain-containing protein n=1 Tax=Nadsonia fulvescens var. elongata DSM 6958 TaxID=857566 RepID=A0A1E3PEN8_9ASCO|nr:ThrRS/AlaRS common domain-containing protein [Nadsonia fulvescens var. elongata DSM 6958]
MSKVYASAIVGALACQKDSYLKTLTTKVVSCVALTVPKPSKSKSKVIPPVETPRYEVEFEDTILFPEGGGQPSDTGVLHVIESDVTIPVFSVRRDGLVARHAVPEPLTPGATVTMNLTWGRRMDHMQQHTGQHLLSAVLDNYELATLSWSMGAGVQAGGDAILNYLDIPRKLTNDEIKSVQHEVNEHIQAALPIRVVVPESLEDGNTKTHKLPGDYDASKGVIRVIEIGGEEDDTSSKELKSKSTRLDHNTCCGTHLSSTSQIGSLVLLHQIPHKATQSRLYFIAGDRVPIYMQQCHTKLRSVNAALSCQMADIEANLTRISLQVRDLTSREKFWMSQAALHEATVLREKLSKSKVAILYLPEASLDFFNLVIKELGEEPLKQATVVLAGGAGKDGGAIVVAGVNVPDIVNEVLKFAPKARGGGKGRWQGKVNEWESGAVELLVEHITNLA